jgi:hypothetical protein
MVGVALAAVTLLGLFETRGFNLTLGRTPPFDAEPPWHWLQVGAQSLVLPAVYILMFFIAMWVVRFLRRLLSLSHTIDRLCSRSVTQTARVSRQLGLDDPTTFGQAVVAIGVVLLAAILVTHWSLVLAFGSESISTRPRSTYAAFQSFGPARLALQWYQFLLVALAAGFAAAAARLRRLRAHSVGRGGAAVAVVLAMMCVSIVLCEWPYRLVYKSSLPRVDVAGARCFLLGESADRLLVHCPDAPSPRNRIVTRTDPALTILGVSENIFDPAPPAGVPNERTR